MELLDNVSIKLNSIADAARYLAVEDRQKLDLLGTTLSDRLGEIVASLKKLESDFHLAATPLILLGEEEVPDDMVEQVEGLLDRMSFEVRSRRLTVDLMSFAAEVGPISGNVSMETNAALRLLSAAQGITFTSIPRIISKDTCKCGAEYVIIPELSVCHCPDCSKVKKIQGISFDVNKSCDPYSSKNKNRSAIMRHYLFWMNRIQAREKIVFDDELLANIRYVMARDDILAQDLKCEKVREILKDPVVKRPKLNDHIPSLIVKLGGPAPPQLTSEESERHRNMFIKIINLYDHRGNKPYYPYFIYKIIEIMFDGITDKLRMLNYIHLQNPETVIRRDQEFEEIVRKSDAQDGLYYRPTNLHSR